MKGFPLLGFAAFLAASAGQAQVNASDVRWQPTPPGRPPGTEIAVLSGDPAKDGIYTIRLKLPPGYSVPAHRHPSDELITVIEGDFAIGFGDTFDKAKMTRLSEGGFAIAPKGTSHYIASPGGGIVQVTAHGPFAITYVNPADDPRKK